jgi:hypothetical protein
MYPFDIDGIIKAGKSQATTQEFALAKEADTSTLRRLIRDIPPQTKVIFYDKDYPSPSDSGAYVSFMRIEGKYVVNRSNHGWSSKWSSITLESLETYFSKCASVHRKGFLKRFEPIFYVSQVEPLSQEHISQVSFEEEPVTPKYSEPKINKYIRILLTALFAFILIAMLLGFLWSFIR